MVIREGCSLVESRWDWEVTYVVREKLKINGSFFVLALTSITAEATLDPKTTVGMSLLSTPQVKTRATHYNHDAI